MKRMILLMLVISGFYGYAQNVDTKDVPSIVRNKFAAAYSSVTDAKWGLTNINNYEAEFTINGIDTSVLYDNKGNILETYVVVKPSELPNPVTDFLAKNYAWKKIREAEKVTDGRGKVNFRVGVGVKEVELVFDYQGNFIRLSK